MASVRVTEPDRDSPSRGARQRQRQVQEEEQREALRALLMRPLLGPQHEAFALVSRHAEVMREWFLRETGWMLEVERAGARLFKRPADLASAVRGFDGYDRRRYVLLCLACVVLERADPQITLRLLGERLLCLAAEPELAALGFTFTLASQQERRELVSVCKTLLGLGVLGRVAGEEEAFVQAAGEQADALYDIHRRALAGMLAAVRGPSTWAPQDAPATLEDRLRALVEEPVPDSEEGRRTAVRHHLARRLLDDPVVYIDRLEPEARAYFINQRGTMAARLCEATGLTPESRAEGQALVDADGELTDVAMPAEGTEAHATLLVADFLARGCRQSSPTSPPRQSQRRPCACPTWWSSCARPRCGSANTGASQRVPRAPRPSWPRSLCRGWRSCISSNATATRLRRCRRSPGSPLARLMCAAPRLSARPRTSLPARNWN
jgi:uncharacterized protein (TIGR02678 family)